ncbi:unnamed protein product [Closterium sp. NIES-65]|nr:unnamed protein product [Closterium sp. NIES-65]
MIALNGMVRRPLHAPLFSLPATIRQPTMNPAASHQSSRSLGASAAPLYPSAPPITASAPPASAASSTISYPALPPSSARFPPSSGEPYSSAPLRMPSHHRPPSSPSAYFPRSPSSASASSSSMSLARNVGRGICASCLAASLFAALVCTSLPLATLLVWRLAPTPFDQTRPLLFDFRQPEPFAVASFLPPPHTLLPPPPQPPASSSAASSASTSASAGRFFSAAPPRLLQRNQRYEAVLRLRLPESDHNLALGMFQISAHALSADYAVLSANSQPATLRFSSRPIRALRTAVLAFPLLWGFREEAQRIELRVLRGLEGKTPVAAVRVMLAPKAGAGPGAGLPQIYDAELRLRAVLGGAGGLWLLAWRVMLFTMCAAGIFGMQAMVLLVCCGGVMIRLLWQGGSKERDDGRGGGSIGRYGRMGSMGEVAGREERGEREGRGISGSGAYDVLLSAPPSAPLAAPAAPSSLLGAPAAAPYGRISAEEVSEEVLRPVFMQGGGERGRGKGKAVEGAEGDGGGMDLLRDEGAITGRVRAWMGEGSSSSSSSSLGVGPTTPVSAAPAVAAASLHAPRYPPIGLAPAAAAPLGRPLGDVGREGAEGGGAGVGVGGGVGAGVGEGGEEGGSDEEIESLLAAGKQLLQDRGRQAVAQGDGQEDEEEEDEEVRGEGEAWRVGLRQRRVGVGRAGGQSVAAVPTVPAAPAVSLGGLGGDPVAGGMGRWGVAEAVSASHAAADAAYRSGVVAAVAAAGRGGSAMGHEGGAVGEGGGAAWGARGVGEVGRGGNEEWEEEEYEEEEEDESEEEEERRRDESELGEEEEEQGQEGDDGEWEDVREGESEEDEEEEEEGEEREEVKGREEERMIGRVDAAAAAATAAVAMVGLGQERRQKQGEKEDKGGSVWVLGAGAAEWDEGESEHGEPGGKEEKRATGR